MLRKTFAALVLSVAFLTAPADAGLYEDIYRGLHLAATPFGSPVFPTADGGLANGQRYGRVRIVPNNAGDGHRLEFDRSFGPDTRGRPEVLDLGPVEFEFDGDIQSTLEYTRRGFLVGDGRTTISNLNYAMRGQTGALDAELTGTLDLFSDLQVNRFGFYNIQFNMSNSNSQLTLDGFLAEGQDDLNFDIGPISGEGNIFVDLFIAGLSAIGIDTSGLSELVPESGISQIASALETQTDRIGDLISAAAEQRASAKDGSVQSLLAPGASAMEPLGDSSARVAPSLVSSDAAGRHAVPEPSTLLLIAGGIVAYAGFRRRR